MNQERIKKFTGVTVVIRGFHTEEGMLLFVISDDSLESKPKETFFVTHRQRDYISIAILTKNPFEVQ